VTKDSDSAVVYEEEDMGIQENMENEDEATISPPTCIYVALPFPFLLPFFSSEY
jgi:hypothetical protein